jgi:antitoxin YefM
MLCELFLELNGWRNEASDAEALAAMLDLAAGDLDENGVAAWLPESCVEGWGARKLYQYRHSEAMDVLTYSDTRANLADVMDKVVRDKTPVVVTRQKHEAVVIVSLADWNAMEEALHLLSSPGNAQRLRDAVSALEAGQGEERDLIGA